MLSNRCLVAVLLNSTLIWMPVPGFAQALGTPGRPAPTSASYVSGLHIIVLDGQDAVNSINTRNGINPWIRVLDANGQGVPGADVVFEAPEDGPGGTFRNHGNLIRVKSDNAGQALVTFTPNDRPGRFQILVTARVGASSSEIAIRQTNDSKARSVYLKGAPKPWYGDWRWWAAIGGGAAVGVMAMSAGGGPTTPAVTIAPGTGIVGGPK